ncbi:MAG TPA: sodium/solute symporter [Steroidobacteraceae bacterium]|nr:sodium/solute symporter [Steroidobacteraceae bacterium]
MTAGFTAIAIFFAFVLATLVITAWASRRARTAAQFYAAEGTVTPWQNGLAIAGDYLSAGSFLGSISVFYSFGVDGLLYAVGAAAGWPVVTCLIAERLRALGQYTFSDVLARRLGSRPVRTLTAVSTVFICGSYLISQMVGAGTLVQVLFGIPYDAAVVLVGALMTTYVIFGGMVATTWIQIVKASILLAAALLMSVLLLHRFDYSFAAVADAAAATRADPVSFRYPQGLLSGPIDAIGLALAFAFGPGGMPHVLMRFFTVRDSRSARDSLVYASSLVVIFQILMIVLGIGAVALVNPGEHFRNEQGELIGGANMAAVYVSWYLGGNPLFGVVAAVTFATILAVVSGLTLAAASAVSHDFYRHVLRPEGATERAEVRVSRVAALLIGCIAIGAGIVFRNQNIGFLATLPLVLAASCNFPILLLSIYWKRLTTAGAVAGGLTGLLLSTVLIVLGPKVWQGALGHAKALSPYDYPTILSLGLALTVAWLVSLRARQVTGLGGAAASPQPLAESQSQ